MDVLSLLVGLLLLVKRSSKLYVHLKQLINVFYSNIYNFDINSRLLISSSSIAKVKSKLYAKNHQYQAFCLVDIDVITQHYLRS